MLNRFRSVNRNSFFFYLRIILFDRLRVRKKKETVVANRWYTLWNVSGAQSDDRSSASNKFRTGGVSRIAVAGRSRSCQTQAGLGLVTGSSGIHLNPRPGSLGSVAPALTWTPAVTDPSATSQIKSDWHFCSASMLFRPVLSYFTSGNKKTLFTFEVWKIPRITSSWN